MTRRRLPLVLATVALAAFFATLHAWRLAPTSYSVTGTQRLPWTILFVATILIAAYATGLPEIPSTRTSALFSATASVVAGLVVVSIAQLLLGSPLLPRVVLGGIGFTFLPVALISWNAEGDRLRRATLRAMFVGSEQEFAELQSDLAGERVQVELAGRVSGADADEVLAFAKDQQVGMVVLDMISLGTPKVVAAVSELHRSGVRVRTVSLFAEEFLGKIPVADLERMSLLFDIGELHRAMYVRWKRVIDVVFSLSVLAILVPVAVVVAVGNRVGNRGPLIYRQDRVGKDGEVFSIFKFRSMVPSDGPTSWTQKNDARITPFGAFLRKSHLDELPQAVNVLRGDLSIVGPRPEQPHYVEALNRKIPFFDVRHLVRPGLTGWAQVKYPYGADEADAREKLQYDLYYLRRQSPRLDVQILVRTIRTVVGRTGR